MSQHSTIPSDWFEKDGRHPKKWFIDRIGKHVKREPIKFNGHILEYDKDRLRDYGIIRILISDETHANYLFDCQNELGARYEEN